MRIKPNAATRTCPWIDAGDPRCARRFSLARLDEAMRYCLKAPSACPVYHQLQAESELERISLTVHGVPPHRLAVDVRPATS
jgi:hypothetical protein